MAFWWVCVGSRGKVDGSLLGRLSVEVVLL